MRIILFQKGVAGMKKSTLAVERCKTVSTIQKILGGKWKIEIIYYIAFRDIHRFGELRRHIGDITESSLTKQLRELEADGFLTRYDYKEVPPHVEYNLTDLGKSFIPVFEHMKQWGDENLSE
jgi:DNA-binding HxlR family transcriptional regulator